jgi:hypothetical protein
MGHQLSGWHRQRAAQRGVQRTGVLGRGRRFNFLYVAGQLGGRRKLLHAQAGRRAVHVDVDLLDVARRHAVEAHRDRQSHLDETLVGISLQSLDRRHVAVLSRPGEIKQHGRPGHHCARSACHDQKHRRAGRLRKTDRARRSLIRLHVITLHVPKDSSISAGVCPRFLL